MGAKTERMKAVSRSRLARWVRVAAAVLLFGGWGATLVQAGTDSEAPEGGILERSLAEQSHVVDVRLMGVTRYEVLEMFNEILQSTPGVVEARRYRLHLEPDRPQACLVSWQVRVEGIGLEQLERDVVQTLRHAVREGSERLELLAFDPGPKDWELLAAIRPWRATTREIEFILPRPRAPKRWGVSRYEGWSAPYWGSAGFE